MKKMSKVHLNKTKIYKMIKIVNHKKNNNKQLLIKIL